MAREGACNHHARLNISKCCCLQRRCSCVQNEEKTYYVAVHLKVIFLYIVIHQKKYEECAYPATLPTLRPPKTVATALERSFSGIALHHPNS